MALMDNTETPHLTAAEQGDAEAQYLLGYMYEKGNSVPQDIQKAEHWYSMAAAQWHAGAEYRLKLFKTPVLGRGKLNYRKNYG